MQLFLPFPDVRKSLEVLDMRRLGKQRVEARQILDCILGVSNGWKNHPAVKMVRDYPAFTARYYDLALEVFEKRGGHNYSLHYIGTSFLDYQKIIPSWFGDKRFHLSHQANLLRKGIDDALGIGRNGKPKKKNTELLDNLTKNGIMESTVDKNLPYFWPV